MWDSFAKIFANVIVQIPDEDAFPNAEFCKFLMAMYHVFAISSSQGMVWYAAESPNLRGARRPTRPNREARGPTPRFGAIRPAMGGLMPVDALGSSWAGAGRRKPEQHPDRMEPVRAWRLAAAEAGASRTFRRH